MSSEKKVRCDAVLQNLPEDRQLEIVEYAKDNGIVKTANWLREDGVDTSKSAVHSFLSWWRHKSQKAKNETVVLALVNGLAKDNPDWTAEQLQQAGNAFFSAMAVEQQNPDDWVSTQRLQLDQQSAKTKADFEKQKIGIKREQLKFEQEKFKEGLRTKLESAFNELAIAVKGNPVAEGHIRKARELIAPQK